MNILLPLFLLFIGTLSAKPVLVFDWAGVMAHYNSTIETTVQHRLGLSAQDTNQAIKEYCIAIDAEKESTFWKKWASRNKRRLPSNFEDTVRKSIPLTFPEDKKMVELVKKLKIMGYQTAMLSNINQWRATLIRALGQYNQFSPVLLSYQIRLEKPNIRIFYFLVSQLATEPGNIIFIDDLMPNVTSARKVGIDAIHFTSYEQLLEDLKKRHIYVYNTNTPLIRKNTPN